MRLINLDVAIAKIQDEGVYGEGYSDDERVRDVCNIANGVTVQEWISVKDRLPENICPVLVALKGLNKAFLGWYQDEKWWTVGAGSRPFTQEVTHWMPLPEPPKGD